MSKIVEKKVEPKKDDIKKAGRPSDNERLNRNRNEILGLKKGLDNVAKAVVDNAKRANGNFDRLQVAFSNTQAVAIECQKKVNEWDKERADKKNVYGESYQALYNAYEVLKGKVRALYIGGAILTALVVIQFFV